MATDAFLRKWIFTEMNFLNSYFRFTFISDSENQKSYNFFFCFQQAFFMAMRSSFFETFRNLQVTTALWSLYFVTLQVPGLWHFSGNFLAFSDQWISRANVATFSKLLDIFPLNFSIVHFYCLKPFAARLLLGKNI